MLTKAIQEGRKYAYNRYDSGTPDEVTVLATDVTEVVKGRGQWGLDEKKRGVKIEFKSGEVDIVRAQTIRQTWADHKAEKKAAKRANEAALARQQVERERTAALAFRFHTALVEKGAKVGLGYDFRDENYAALVAAGFQPATEMDRVYSNHVHTALNGLSTFMDKEILDADQVAFLLGWADEAPRPEDSLDDYDLDDEAP